MINIPLFKGFRTSQVVQDFFHQQYYQPKLNPLIVREIPAKLQYYQAFALVFMAPKNRYNLITPVVASQNNGQNMAKPKGPRFVYYTHVL